MAFVQRIIVATDFSDHARSAYEPARALAEAFGSEVVLAHVHDSRVPRPAEHGVRLASTAEADGALKAQLETVAARELPGAEVALIGSDDVAGALCKLAEERGADLVVIATHGVTGLKRLFLGSVAEAVVRNAPCPVLTVRAKEDG